MHSHLKFFLCAIPLLVLVSFFSPASAQQVSIPDAGLEAALRDALHKPVGPLTSADLLSLTVLDAQFRNITNADGLEFATNLRSLDLHINQLTNFTLPPVLSGNLTNLDLSENEITSFVLPATATNLQKLNLFFNQLTNLVLPSNSKALNDIDLDSNKLKDIVFPSGLTGLHFLHLRANLLTNFTLPADMTALTYLDVSEGPLQKITLPAGLSRLGFLRLSQTALTRVTLPPGMTNLIGVNLTGCQLTNVALPSDLNNLSTLDLSGNPLASLTLPSGLISLTGLFFTEDQLTSLTLPPDVTQLSSLGLVDNPLRAFVLPEPLATSTNLVDEIAALRQRGVAIFTYPLTMQLVSPQSLGGAFEFSLSGPPGVYTIFSSLNLADWSASGAVTNQLGTVHFIDPAPFAAQKFFRARVQESFPTNLVFIPPNTFTMGSPANELGRSADEGPQMTVTLTRGFYMAKYLVTQRDYLAVTGSNPSGFPGDPNRPVESVSWLDATNYCALLTEQDRAAGRIPAGSHYRLPTEAEWECAARAGTSTRYNYGDDPGATALSNHAWYGAHGGVTTHPVGQKQPNAWGLYDMAGNVWEWCLDWYGPYAGGSISDPQGPAGNAIGVKVIRGGAWESFESDCRSARRSTEGVSPLIKDFIIGFRVVLATEP